MAWLCCEPHGRQELANALATNWPQEYPDESMTIAKGQLRSTYCCDRCNCELDPGLLAYLVFSWPSIQLQPSWRYRKEYFGPDHEVWFFPSRHYRICGRPVPPPAGVLLDLPTHEKAEARALGAAWAPWLRRWYVPAHLAAQPFERWIKGAVEPLPLWSDTGPQPRTRSPRRRQEATAPHTRSLPTHSTCSRRRT